MNFLDYYFSVSFQWNQKWFSTEGLLRPVIRLSNEKRNQYGWIDFDILESTFTDYRMLKEEYVAGKIGEIEEVIEGKKAFLIIGNEIVALNVLKDFTKIEDNLGDPDGVEGPLSWNISTPKELQYIPTTEILQLFMDWKQFLIEQESVILNFDQ